MNVQFSIWLGSALGGLLIGIAAALMLVMNGRVTGISGIIYEIIKSPRKTSAWRWNFLGGLLSGGVVLLFCWPEAFQSSLKTPYHTLIIAGLLVGFGTRLGGGCTSGHGVCGVSRLSPRSIVATILFLVAGIITATFIRKLGFL